MEEYIWYNKSVEARITDFLFWVSPLGISYYWIILREILYSVHESKFYFIHLLHVNYEKTFCYYLFQCSLCFTLLSLIGRHRRTRTGHSFFRCFTLGYFLWLLQVVFPSFWTSLSYHRTSLVLPLWGYLHYRSSKTTEKKDSKYDPYSTFLWDTWIPLFSLCRRPLYRSLAGNMEIEMMEARTVAGFI